MDSEGSFDVGNGEGGGDEIDKTRVDDNVDGLMVGVGDGDSDGEGEGLVGEDGGEGLVGEGSDGFAASGNDDVVVEVLAGDTTSANG